MWRVLLTCLKPVFVKDVIHSQYRETVVTLGIKATKCKKGLFVAFKTDIVKFIAELSRAKRAQQSTMGKKMW